MNGVRILTTQFGCIFLLQLWWRIVNRMRSTAVVRKVRGKRIGQPRILIRCRCDPGGAPSHREQPEQAEKSYGGACPVVGGSTRQAGAAGAPTQMSLG
jgi:hypothetical protein